MIPINELRVGNWYKQLHTGHFTQVSLFLLGEIDDDESYLDSIIPIPISSEILENCGFEKIQEGSMAYPEVWRKKYTKVLVETNFDIQSRDSGEWKWIEGNTIADVESLHQLQNLYHSLTGKELEYTPLVKELKKKLQ